MRDTRQGVAGRSWQPHKSRRKESWMVSQDAALAHAELLKLAASGRVSRRDIFKRGMALGLSSSAIAGALMASNVAAQDASPAVGTSSLAGKTIDMTILSIAGFPP